ncbi:hypothetical protein LCX93_08610 [Sulfurimonas sp. SWIR-19]|nr:hypothetical protein LCX93_08610 [Sulfurimonas sp. SWIR-19]
MIDYTQPVSTTFIITTILAVFVMIGIGILAVKKFKKES